MKISVSGGLGNSASGFDIAFGGGSSWRSFVERSTSGAAPGPRASRAADPTRFALRSPRQQATRSSGRGPGLWVFPGHALEPKAYANWFARWRAACRGLEQHGWRAQRLHAR